MSTRIARNLVAAFTTLAVATWAVPARADHDRGEWREGARGTWAPIPAPVVVAPAPYRPASPAYAPAPPAPATWRVARWRAERREELRHEYRALEHARARFYATWDGRPWSRNRFEAWYATRRADLDARSAQLSYAHR